MESYEEGVGSTLTKYVSSEVRRADGRRVALKRLTDDLRDEETIHLRVLGHAHIVALLRVFTVDSSGARYLELEWAPHGSLYHECDALQRQLAVPHVAAIAVQLASALQHCHAHGVLHCDVKCENVLVFAKPGVDGSERYVVKLADFGLAVCATETALVRGSFHGMAPERLACTAFGPPADAWSLGILLYEVCAGIVPFLVDERASDQIMPPDGRVDWAELVPAVALAPDGAGDLIGALLREAPGDRLHVGCVAEHSWILLHLC